MAITFKLVRHSITGDQVIEILKEGVVCAVLYPDREGVDVKVVSAHFAGKLAQGGEFPAGVIAEAVMDNGGEWPPIPSIKLRFDPRPYHIEGNQIKRTTKQ